MLIICDFDGTVTSRDTNSALARRFAPDAYAGLEGKLAARELTLREVLTAEFEGITAGIDALLAQATRIPLRAGFGEFVEAAERDGHELVLLSSGFREIIEPILAANDLAGRVPLVANSIALDESGGAIEWRELPECDLCGEPCKRFDVTELRDRTGAQAVVFVGDGLSDRCGAEAADRIFARDSLARYLDERSVTHDGWDDFHDVARALGISAPEVV